MRDIAGQLAVGSGARLTVTEDIPAAVAGADFLYTDVWLSMGEPAGEWDERIDLLLPYQVNPGLHRGHREPGGEVHALPARRCTTATPRSGSRLYDKRGLDALEVTEEVFESPASIVFDQAENRLHTIKAVMVATAGRIAVRIVAALGGNALLERGEPPDADIQEAHVVAAVARWPRWRRDHDLVITHGNGPQVGMLALESAHDPASARPYPFDVLGAQTQGMIGYWLVQALQQRACPAARSACLISRTLVRADDPAFAQPDQVRRPGLRRGAGPRAGRQPAAGRSARTARRWRRVVPSPEPAELLDLPADPALLDTGAIVVCAGGGGVPVVAATAPGPHGVEAVVDKDLTAALLARQLRRGRAAAAHRRGGGPGRLRHPAGPADPPGHARRAAGPVLPGRVDGPQGRGRLPLRRGRPASWRPSVSSPTPRRCSPGTPGPSSPAKPRGPRRQDRARGSGRRA